MKHIKTFNKLALSLLIGATMQSCSLDEFNPGGFTMEATAKTTDGYDALVNQCYFSMQRFFYGTDSWMSLTEGETDLWTFQANKSTSYTQWFWYFAGAAPNTTYTNNWWNGTYDGIGACNTALSLSHLPPYKTLEELNYRIAQVRFLRAIYYFNAVEQFGAVTMITTVPENIDFEPKRTDPLTIYEKVIIPDLQFAAEWLRNEDDAVNTIPGKKAALGFLAKAYLQTVEYDDSKQYAANALETAKLLIEDAEAGGAQYGAYMYPDYQDVFAEKNNFSNKEALWKHRWYAGADGHGSSNGNYKLNRNNEYFTCSLAKFPAWQDNQEQRLKWGGYQGGIFMPTQHLISLYVQNDGSLDPRFEHSFTREWESNRDYTWNQDAANRYDKNSSVVGQSLAAHQTAIRFIMPQDADYAELKAGKHDSKLLVIDYADIFNDDDKTINMTYSYTNPSEGYTNDGSSENLFNYFYPSLNKHNSSNYYVANESKMRNGNLNSTFMMRMAEVYLIAAEADIYVNGGSKATDYINVVRRRAGANDLVGSATVRSVLDERGRELCGEYCRFYDLKRTGMLKNKGYLEQTNPDLAQYFIPEYALRPISTTFTATLLNGGAYYQNPGY